MKVILNKNTKTSFKEVIKGSRRLPRPLPNQNSSRFGLMLFSLPFLVAGLGIISLSLGFFEGNGFKTELIHFLNEELWRSAEFWLEQPKKASIRRYALSCVGFIFFLAGAFAFFQSLFSKSPQKSKYRGAHNNSPWLNEYPWHKSEAVKRKSNSGTTGGFIASLVLSLFMVIGYEIYLQSGTKLFFIASILISTLILLGTIKSTIKKSKQRKAYGPIELHYSAFPIQLGSEIDCDIRFKKSVHLKNVKILIQCAEEYWQKTSNNSRSLKTKAVYLKEINLPKEELRPSSVIHFKLEIPDEQKFKTHIKYGKSRFWEVSLIGKNDRNIKFNEKYLIPVY